MTFAPDLWTALGDVLRLQPQAFVRDVQAPDGFRLAFAIVFIAGLSEAVGQSVVLFANRVKPLRFVSALAIQVLLFVFGYAFLVFSTWLICALPLSTHAPLRPMAIAFALSYTPLWFAFLSALPYLGSPLSWLLRVWHLLAMVVGFAAVSGVSERLAPLYVGLGWVVLITVQHTLGKPVAAIGAKLLKAAAGVDLRSYDVRVDTARFTAADGTSPQGAQAGVAVAPHRGRGTIPWPGIAGAALAIVLSLVVAVSLEPLRLAVFDWYGRAPALVRLPLDLIWIGLIALVVAGLLAPLETLGWWAGWYGGELDTGLTDTAAADAMNADGDVTRYVVYLDGIAQSSARYTPDIERFLDELAPRLPQHVRLIRGIMSYSVLNRPLDNDPLFSALWRFVDAVRLRNVKSILGMIINLRNVLIVAVSADQRYGPMYNFGIAQIIYDALVANGYRPKRGIPVTLLGYSGGGQMAAASSAMLKRAIDAPIDVISLGGVISGASKLTQLEQLYHHAGSKDGVQRLGPIMFPTRWKIAIFSNWNCALRLGRISFVRLGPVGHQSPGGLFDPDERLPDGRTFLEQTLACVTNILSGRVESAAPTPPIKASNYDRYVVAAWNRPDYYPIGTAVDPDRYLPIAEWMGRLVLPKLEEREDVGGAWFEVHHAPPEHRALVGRTVKLRWNDERAVRNMVHGVTRDVHFSPRAQYTSRYGGLVHPTRLNHWQLVDPLESLAGARPFDDAIVMLAEPPEVTGLQDDVVLRIGRQPVQITGRFYALVRFEAAAPGEQFRVTHFRRETRDFSGASELVHVPAAVPDAGGRLPWSTHALEDAEPNGEGWFIYGAPDAAGTFVVQALAPRALLRVQPKRTLAGSQAAHRYVRHEVWSDPVAHKGTVASTRLSNGSQRTEDAAWAEGDEALLVHVFGGIGGRAGESIGRSPLYFGHFAYGVAQVVREPLSAELVFNVVYYQVYTTNTDGLTAGALHWSRYMGDRQFGWAGLRPVCDILLTGDAFDASLPRETVRERAPLAALRMQLEAMTARYRTGDGSGGTYVGAANNCAQDSNRALFATLQSFGDGRHDGPRSGLERLATDLRAQLQPFGMPRRDWSDNEFNLGTTIEDSPFQSLRNAFGSWRVMLPRFASDTIVQTFLRHGASAWVLFTDQIGGRQDDLEPIAPTTL